MSGLSLETSVSNFKSVALTIFELLAFNSHWPAAAHSHTDKQTHIERTHYLRHSLRSLGGDNKRTYIPTVSTVQRMPTLKKQKWHQVVNLKTSTNNDHLGQLFDVQHCEDKFFFNARADEQIRKSLSTYTVRHPHELKCMFTGQDWWSGACRHLNWGWHSHYDITFA